MSARRQHGFFRPLALRLAAPARQKQQVFFGRADARAHSLHLLREIAIQPLGIVIHAQPALLAERLQLVALFAADLADLGNANGHQRQPFGREPRARKQIFDAMERRDAQVGFVAAIGAHRLGVRQPGKRRGHLVAGHFARPRPISGSMIS